jgi:cyclic 2,3-diphosphoglycerate synthetase
VLVDGEHRPSVVRAALDDLRSRGAHVVGVAMLGGAEKLALGPTVDLGAPVVGGPSALDALVEACRRFAPEEIVDLSDEPVVDARVRALLAGHALARGIRYRGADFVFTPPPRPRVCAKPSIAVIGTGKRTGKTTITQAIARRLAASRCPPVIVTMARGGPASPELVDPAVEDLSVRGLLERAARGEHAASDHLEDALVTGVPTVGTQRCGSGVAGTPAFDSFAEGVRLANERPEPFLLLEGSGTAIPPVHADVTVCAVPIDTDAELVTGHLGVTALLLSDLVIATLDAESGRAGLVPPHRTEPVPARELTSRVRTAVPGVPVVSSRFRPAPLEPVDARRVFLTTTASPDAATATARHLETEWGAAVVGGSTNLAIRQQLRHDLEHLGDADVLVTEVKAAGIDTAARTACERGIDVVFLRYDVELDDGSFDARVATLAETARRRFAVDGGVGS